MTTTNTRTHTHISFANPHLTCTECGQPASGFHDPERCGCTATDWLLPCRHEAEIASACPTWSPVDGCQCEDKVNHR